MLKNSAVAICLLCWLAPLLHTNATNYRVFDLLDLKRPGLEKVDSLHRAGNDSVAAEALLDYFRAGRTAKSVGVDPLNPNLTKEELRWADEALEHKFFVHTGYQPSFFYGDDIDWTYWPVKDNELRWQLHRTKWWVPMGKAYKVTGDEKYALEWTQQYLDWIKKNPLTRFDRIRDKDMETADNVYFAWRPLEVADRVEHQIEQFELFLPSRHFTADFLLSFLENYHRHAQFITRHFSARGNHLLFEAQRLLFAGAFFPEFKEAAAWRAKGVEILNTQIGEQVLADGVQFELDPGYHNAAIDIFGKALHMMSANGYTAEFPPEYIAAIDKMTRFSFNIMFPDYTFPLFSDSRQGSQNSVVSAYQRWSNMIPTEPTLEYYATRGAIGTLPNYNSCAFPHGGFYVLRNGWDNDATVMVLKAGPAGEWHNQYDNGTFNIWHKGRNFFPDSGSYIYGGDSTVLAQRDWFRQTAVHNTLTLNNRNLENRVSKLLKFDTDSCTEVLVVETPGYDGLTHRRSVFFVDRKFYVIADEAYGDAVGDIAIHYQLLPCQLNTDTASSTIATKFDDGNNLLLTVHGAQQTLPEEGWTSPVYREKISRPAYAFSTLKSTSEPVRFITVIYPCSNPDDHRIKADYDADFSAQGTSLTLDIDGESRTLSTHF